MVIVVVECVLELHLSKFDFHGLINVVVIVTWFASLWSQQTANDKSLVRNVTEIIFTEMVFTEIIVTEIIFTEIVFTTSTEYLYTCMFVRSVCVHWIYVCVYIYTYIYIYICMYVCMYVCLHPSIHISGRKSV